MSTYQLVAYGWGGWIGKQVMRATNSSITHVSIRVNTHGEASKELYVSYLPTDTWVRTSAVHKIHNVELWKSREIPIDGYQIDYIKQRANHWKATQPGSVVKCFLFHHVGRHLGLKTPACCTQLCSEILNFLNVPTKETFYPNRLVSEFIKETC